MHLIKISVAALNQTPLDWHGNTQRIIEVLKQAQAEKIQFLGLPEMALCGYGCEDAFFSPDTTDRAFQALETLLPYTKGMVVNIGLPIRYKGALFNGIAVLCNGEIAGLVPKKFLAGDGVHYEPRWFKPWPAGHTDILTIDNLPFNKTLSHQKFLAIPIGDLYFQWKDIRFGYEICEEAWVSQRPGSRLAEQSIDILFNPSASHFAFGKNEIRKRFVLEGSRAFSCVYAYANLLGNESGRIIFDGSLFLAQQGELINESSRFSFKDFQMITSIVDLNLHRAKRNQTASFNPAAVPMPFALIPLKAISLPTEALSPLTEKTLPTPPNLLPQLLSKNEEFLKAASLGLFDYLRKSQNQGFAISLSGGTDSSVVALLASSAFQLAAQELGLTGLKNKLAHIKAIQNDSDLKQMLPKLIHCVYQSTQNSSAATQNAAQTLAQALGVTYSEWSIESIRVQFENLVSQALGHSLTWADNDLALQNIQARVRSPGIWLLANIKKFLLLTTCNRSEAAAGYATMDGDTSGGLAPLTGVDKAFLSQWIRWKGETPEIPLGPIPELKLVYGIPPTAELRPQQFQQEDEKDLMPYPVLDFIERHLLIDRLKPQDLLKVLTMNFTQYPPIQLRDWLVLFLKLWTKHQWKRERLAPSFHLDAESLDPKTWCRFPILSKAFEQDIEELQVLFKN